MILTFRNIYSKIKIQNLFFFVVYNILGLWGFILFFWGEFFVFPELIATSILYLVCSSLSIPSVYNRYFSYRSSESSQALKYFGASHFINSAKKWAQDLRQNHQLTDDTKLDPSPISRGFGMHILDGLEHLQGLVLWY